VTEGRSDADLALATAVAGLGSLSSGDLADARALLGASPLFADVPPDELAATCRRLTLLHFGPGEVIIRARELGDSCYIIRDGRAEILSDDLIGEEVQIRVAGPGEILGEIALLKDVLRSATVRAVVETEAYVLDRVSFLHLAETCPTFVQRVRQRVDLNERLGFLRRASPFAHLPPDDAVGLARTLRPVNVQAGELVIREGERGDCFYLVRSGRLEVRRAGRNVQELATGDYFGEVALLVDGPRMATVRAREDSELLALRRPAFVEIIGAYPQLRAHVAEMVRLRGGGDLTPDRAVGPTAPDESILPTQRRAFWLTLFLGLGLFVALGDAARVVNLPALSYATLIVGALVGPVTYVVYLASTNVLTRQPLRLALTFIFAAIGVELAVQVEVATGVLRNGLPYALAVAAIEETIKALAVVWLLRRAASRFEMDGVIYGAAAGMGFAALESILFGYYQLSAVSQMLGVLWLRTLLSPFEHGTWTAIICATIWRAKGSGPARWDWRVLAAFAVSVGLHAAWDWPPVGAGLYYYYLGVGAVGLAILGWLVRSARVEQASAVAALNPELIPGQDTATHVSLDCLRCGQLAPAGAHYCPRCGVALRS